MTPNLVVLTSKPDLKLPLSLVHHPVLRLPSSWFSPTSCYFTPRLFSATPSLPTTPINSPVLPHPAPPLPLLLPYGVWGEGGLGFSMGVSNFRDCIAGLLLTGGHVTHQSPCCTHATLLLHMLMCANTHTHTHKCLCQGPFTI